MMIHSIMVFLARLLVTEPKRDLKVRDAETK
jgi:hypothetical protein